MAKARLEDGAAAVNIELRNGIITVRHSSPEGEVLLEGDAEAGSWEKLFDLLENDIGLERV